VAEGARVTFLVNSGPGGVLAPRAVAFARGLAPEFRAQVLWRDSTRPRAIVAFIKMLRRIRPDVLYVIDLGFPAVLASFLHRAFTPCALVIETGDPLAELLWSTGRVGDVGRLALRRYERGVLSRADHLVVRGTGLRDYLNRFGVTRIDTVTDGVDTEVFRPMEVAKLRKELGTEGYVSIGTVGTLNWSRRLGWGYGCELIEVLTLLRHLPVFGLVLGDGPGRTILERRAAERGVSERIRFLGHIPHESLAPYINAMDICLSTQTNDWVGRARTTAKLPLFLACGRFVLASRVGEAARLLPPEMLVDYREGFDPTYPERLAIRVEQLVREPSLLTLGKQGRSIAESEFDYRVLVPQVARLLRSILASRGRL
jgi:glycosyltransferase involved in cell wall biosynthesis